MIENYKVDYEEYFVEYNGNINVAFENIKYAFVQEVFPICSMICVEKGRLNDLLRDVKNIISIEENSVFSLAMMSEEYYRIGDKHTALSSDYTGKGVIVGLISHGVDSLDKSLLDDVGNSRVISLWNQDIESEKLEKGENNIFYNKKFNKKVMEREMNLDREYERKCGAKKYISSKSFGTNLCNIIGGNPRGDIKPGIAKECEYAIVNLRRAKESIINMNAIGTTREELYETYDIITALKYLSEVKKARNKPMVVYLPIETNSGGRSGESIIDKFIEYYSQSKYFVVITNSGGEGDGYTHNEGILKVDGDISDIEVMVDCDEGENNIVDKLISNERNETYKAVGIYNFKASIWVNKNDKIGIRIISPQGEVTDKICKGNIFGEIIKYKLKSGAIEVQFLSARIGSNRSEVLIKFRDISRGVWKVEIIGEYVLYGDYEVCLPIKSLTNYNVRFKYPSAGRTLNSVSSGHRVISSACYCQNEKNIRVISGKGFSQDNRVCPTISVDSTGILVLDRYGDIIKLKGIPVSGAVLASAIALLLEWAVVQKNHCHITFEDIKLYIIKSTIKYEGDFPNEKWGYGLFDIDKFNEILVGNKMS